MTPKNKRILLIDDVAGVRAALQILLEGAGYEVTTAPDGRSGMELFSSAQPDLVITDIIMPDQEGIETIREIRRLHPSMPIIAMSGGGRARNADFLRIAKALGANATLAKPFDGAELIREVETCLAA